MRSMLPIQANNELKVRLELINVTEWEMGPEDAMQIDLIPEILPSRGYEKFITAKDVFSGYVFEHPVSTPLQ